MKGSAIWLAAGVVLWTACAAGDQDTPPAGSQQGAAPDSAAATELAAGSASGDLIQGDTVPGLPAWTQQDWEVLRRTVESAWQNKIEALPVGERIARIGETFVGSPYLPATLDPPGPERLVINLRAMDCVTFVENMIALAHFVREAPRDVLARPEEAMRLYQGMIERIRYRDGKLAGYPSRLHYFTDWLRDNEEKGLMEIVTEDLGGVVDPEPISFMSAHRPTKAGDPYQPMMEEGVYQQVVQTEAGLNRSPRRYIPKDQVAAAQSRIKDGDILAMTTTIKGLDVAHTGIAVWRGGAVHLLNAPLVGKNVEISEKAIADRLAGIKSQDGLMVARPEETRLLGQN